MARALFPWVVLAALLFSAVFSTLGGGLPPADFTFCNESEVKSLDPAIVTGSPENRMINALFEGLTRLHPQTLEPIPGVAERWELSDDGLVYTFHLRDTARWSDGTPVTAADFHYSLRRFLGPRTAAEYSYQAWYIKNGRKYNRGGSGVEPGDPVEVELNLPPDAVNSLRGELLHGTFLRLENQAGEPLPEEERDSTDRVFVVEIDGQENRFVSKDDADAGATPPEGLRWCRQVLFDFREVGVEAIDERTLQITLESPTPFFLSLMGFYPLYPVNQTCVEAHGSPAWTYPENLVGNGPFTMRLRRIRDRIRLAKSETYWNRDEVKLNVIDALAVDSITTAMNLYMTGNVDWITEAPPTALRELIHAEPPRDDINPSTWLSSYYYLLNTEKAPLDDLRVRQALHMAVNREEIATKILAAGEQPALSLVPPGIEGYVPQLALPQDPDEARRLLAEAGFPDGKGFPRIDILYNTHEAHQSIAELIRKQWQRELGISVRTRNEEWGTYLSSQRQARYDVCRKGWVGDYADPNTFLDMFVTGGEQNNTGWGDPRYDELIAAAARESDPDKRMAIFREAEQILMRDLPILPLYYYVSKNLVKPHVRGFYNNVQDFHPLWSIWIDRSGAPNEFMQGARGR